MALLVFMIYVLAAAILIRTAWGAPPDNPLTSDGCTYWPDGNWVACCHQHDYDYWFGGSYEERAVSDAKLAACVEAAGHTIIGAIMHIGVRIGGLCWIPWAHRWGNGWPWPACGAHS